MNAVNHGSFMGRVYFAKFDRVTIGGIPYRVASENSEGYLLIPELESSLTQLFTFRELSAHNLMGNICVEQGFFAPERHLVREGVDFDISLLTEKQLKKFAVRYACCAAIEHFRSLGEVQLTLRSLKEEYAKIKLYAESFLRDFLGEQTCGDKPYGGGTCTGFLDVCPRTLFEWYKEYRKFGISGLVDRRWRSGRTGSRLCAESEAIVKKGIERYLNRDQPTKIGVVRDIWDDFVALNESRAIKGLPSLKPPSRNTILKRLRLYSPYEVALHREGRVKAQARFFAVGAGLQVGRPLERVEMDGWKVDLMTLARSTGLFHKLAPELVEKMGLNGGKKRWYLIAAVCCTTRCIVGMTLSETENSESAIDCMRMIVSDKGQISDAVGAMSPWDMHGIPDLLVTDNGSAFKSHKFLVSARCLSLNCERAIAGLPQLRAMIERLFGTVSTNLISRLTGRTFSDVVERGEYPSELRTVHTVQEFANMLIRWVVDVYHNTPHEGLGGETPFECWRRLTEVYGVRPGPDRRSRRLAFGVTMKRKLSNVGLQVLGVRYNNEMLMHQLRNCHDRAYELRWFHGDIGEIEVRIGDEWHTVQSVLPEFRGRSARDWIAARNVIRKGDPTLRDASDRKIRMALEEIDRLNTSAGERAGILSEQWDREMIERLEEKTLLGFRAGHELSNNARRQGHGSLVEVSEQVNPAEANVSAMSQQASKRRIEDDWEF